MKKITVAFVLSLMILTCFAVYRNAAEVSEMTDKFVRVHVIANSDSLDDQELKLKVRDGVLEAASEILDGCLSKEDALCRLAAGIGKITSAANGVLEDCGSSFGAVCSLNRETFSARVYDDFTLPAGEYDSLTVRIGEGKGKNWWCVCYPEICFGASSRIDDCAVLTEDELTVLKTPAKVKYKLYCYELFLKIKRLFTAL